MSNSGSAAESARRGCAEQLFDKLEDATPNIADEIRNRDFRELVAESNREQEQFEQLVEDENGLVQKFSYRTSSKGKENF
jgi:hypothetical protein